MTTEKKKERDSYLDRETYVYAYGMLGMKAYVERERVPEMWRKRRKKNSTEEAIVIDAMSSLKKKREQVVFLRGAPAPSATSIPIPRTKEERRNEIECKHFLIGLFTLFSDIKLHAPTKNLPLPPPYVPTAPKKEREKVLADISSGLRRGFLKPNVHNEITPYKHFLVGSSIGAAARVARTMRQHDIKAAIHCL